jgi:uncharacterized protein YcbX
VAVPAGTPGSAHAGHGTRRWQPDLDDRLESQMTEQHTGKVSELWRFPVKSMAGERLTAAEVTAAGFTGDRSYALLDVESGKIASAKLPRQWGSLLECQARTLEESTGAGPPPVGIKLADGAETRSDDPDVDAKLSEFCKRSVRLVTTAPEGAGYLAVWPDIEGVIPADFLAENRIEADGADEEEGAVTNLGLALAAPGTFFDLAPLHVVTRATLAKLGELVPESAFAVRRFRPNVVVDLDVAPFAENDWRGVTLTLGASAAAMFFLPTMRCIMTTLAQGDLPRDTGVLRAIARHNRIEIPGAGTWSCVGSYATVSATGRVSEGDEAVLTLTD